MAFLVGRNPRADRQKTDRQNREQTHRARSSQHLRILLKIVAATFVVRAADTARPGKVRFVSRRTTFVRWIFLTSNDFVISHAMWFVAQPGIFARPRHACNRSASIFGVLIAAAGISTIAENAPDPRFRVRAGGKALTFRFATLQFRYDAPDRASP